MSDPRLSQAAALLHAVLLQKLPSPCSLEGIEQWAHQLCFQIGCEAAQQAAETVVAQAEAEPPRCPCGRLAVAEGRRPRELLLLLGLIRVRPRRYRCPGCGSWSSPAAQALGLQPRQRMTRRFQDLLCRLGLSWSYPVAAQLLGRFFPGASVSAKTVARCVARGAEQVETVETAQAKAALREEGPPAALERPFANPARLYLGFDGILVRGRGAKEWLEVQVASLWSACRELPGRKHRRREIEDATFVARAKGWAALGEQVWGRFVGRGGVACQEAGAELVVLGDGAQGIRSLWEWHFAEALALLDPWHLWEKVRVRSREVLGNRELARAACQGVWEVLKVGAVEQAAALIRNWPVRGTWAEKQRERLLAYLERNRDIIRNYEALRAAGYQVGSGLTEKANELVVAARMKDGKMHWSREGANRVAMLRAWVLTQPDASILPS